MSNAAEDLGALESVEEETRPAGATEAEFRKWREDCFAKTVPSLFMDKSLRILGANDRFLALFGESRQPAGRYLTEYFRSYFDEKRSAELFRSILSHDAGFTWSGRVEQTGGDQLTTIAKLWVVPVLNLDSPEPHAFCAFCLDITQEYRKLLQDTFASLLGAARLKDNDTGNHIERVNQYARALAERMSTDPRWPQVDRQFVESIGQVSALHDIGKIGTPDDILNKAGPLETWEWDVMKQHTTNGAFILATYPNPMAREIALRHHERWDGTGYPHQLSGELIPLSARIVMFADVYDALRMARSYKEGYSHALAVQTMQAESGTHFDPTLMEPFASGAGEFAEIYAELSDQK